MANAEFVLSRAQRDEIMAATRAIQRQLQEMASKPQWQVLMVIGTNLTIIQQNLMDLQKAREN